MGEKFKKNHRTINKNMKHIQLFEEYIGEAKKPATPEARALYKLYRKIGDRMLIKGVLSKGPALIVWGKAMDAQEAQDGKPTTRSVEEENRKELQHQLKRLPKINSEIQNLEAQVADAEAKCTPEELRVIKEWFMAEKRYMNHMINCDWRVTDTAIDAYKVLGDKESLNAYEATGREYAKEEWELNKAETRARNKIYDMYRF